ncbi:hypothetical protein [Gluconobacter thailandicus]|uniref:Uncharacterized protein n=1 Tax=Gluconobacter thailandicus TaxID=257438 RepID=A0AAP9JJY9_GLUTH|nr:hypothetical protein [Gluconobacter thailandicus]QEH97879.1 hypothetical protein FXF46_16475 [Gluconobacter thailandicus]
MSDLDDLVRCCTTLIETQGYRFETGIPGVGALPAWRVAQTNVLLPVLLRLAEEFWRSETKGAGFGLKLEPDTLSVTGYTLTGLYHVPLSIALLALNAVLRTIADAEGRITLEVLTTYAQTVTG